MRIFKAASLYFALVFRVQWAKQALIVLEAIICILTISLGKFANEAELHSMFEIPYPGEG